MRWRLLESIAVSFSLFAAASVAAPGDMIYSRPGQIVPAGDGANLNLYCLGTGSPTVVLESGFEDWAPAWACAAADRPIHPLTMPNSMSKERVALLRQYGAEVVLTPGILMAEAVARAREITERTPGAINLDQFSNPANPALHKRTTEVEIWNDTNGAVEPTGAAVLSGGPAGSHQMPGIGVGFVPPVLNRKLLDEVIAVSDADAFACARRLAREEGVLAGVSAGAALHASLDIAARPESAGKMIVLIICDTGERYLSSALFADN